MVINKALKNIQEFIQFEASAGIILMIVAVLALIVDNTPLSHWYNALLSMHFSIQLGPIGLEKPLVKWVNDGLMAIFFLLVGLEIKREILEGELNSLAKLALPGFAALGGMLIPALIYVFINWGDDTTLHGWAIPVATDIAFALGVLNLLGSRVPSSIKVFLTALAILDDLGAIIIIAIFYTGKLSLISLGLAGICVIVLIILNRSNVTAYTPYALIGIILWICVLKSGVHATLAGVVLAMAVPLKDKRNPQYSPLRNLEHALNPWVAFLVLPIFAFFNAGVPFDGVDLSTFIEPVTLGIILGLFIGKQIGVFGASWLAVKCKLAKLPDRADWRLIYGAALLCGIGFTMSLFIGTLAFDEQAHQLAVLVRLGVLCGSFISGILGYLLLHTISKNNRS